MQESNWKDSDLLALFPEIQTWCPGMNTQVSQVLKILKSSNFRDHTGVRGHVSQRRRTCISPLFPVWLKMVMDVSHLPGGWDG